MNELSRCFREAEEWIGRAECPCERALAYEWYYEVIATIDWLQ